jgi:hypothetical protein
MRSNGYPDIRASSRKGERTSAGSQGPDASRYVLTNEGNLIDISNVSPDDRYAQGPYSCLASGHLMFHESAVRQNLRQNPQFVQQSRQCCENGVSNYGLVTRQTS